MNGRRTFAVTKKVLRSLRHDPRSIALMLVAPILAMMIFGFAFGSEIAHVPVALVNEDAGPIAQRLVDGIDKEAIDLHAYESADAALQAVKDGKERAMLRFPESFSADVQRGNATLDVQMDGSNSQYVAHIGAHLQKAAQNAIASAGGRAPVSVQSTFVYAEGARYIDFFVPGIMAFAVMVLTTLLTLLAFVGERTTGTLTRLLVTPVRGAEIVAGYALAFGMVAAVQGGVLITVALLVFDAMVVNSGLIWLAFLIVILVAIDAMSLGILLSSAAKRELQAVQMIPLIIFPTFLLSGIFVPVDALPSWLQPFAWLIPPTYGVDALRNVMLRGWGLEHVWWNVAALVGFGAVFLTAAAWRIERARAS